MRLTKTITSYHKLSLHACSMQFNGKRDFMKFRWRRRRLINLMHCRGLCKIAWSHWKMVWHYRVKWKMHVLYDPVISLLVFTWAQLSHMSTQRPEYWQQLWPQFLITGENTDAHWQVTRYTRYVSRLQLPLCNSRTQTAMGTSLRSHYIKWSKSKQRFKSKPTNLEARCRSMVTTAGYGRIVARKRSGKLKVIDWMF